MRVIAVLAFVTLGVTACDPKTSHSKDPAPEPKPAPEEAAPAEEAAEEPMDSETVEERMHARFTAGAQIRDALVRGDLGAAKDPAQWLEETPGKEALREAWNPHLANMHTAAHEVRYAAKLEDATGAAARIAQSCGACHTALGATVTVEASDPPPDAPDTSMQRHHWALDKMWQGLTTPNAAAWTEGAAVLSESSIPVEDMGDASTKKQLRKTVKQVAEFAVHATKASTTEQRVEVYGQLLATCASCHAELDPVDGPD